MSILLQRINEKSTIYENGVEYPNGIFVPDWVGNTKHRNTRPSPRFLDVQQQEDEEETEVAEDVIFLSLDSLNGDLLIGDVESTRLIPSLSVNGEPILIEDYTWFKNGEQLPQTEKFLNVSIQDFDKESTNIYSVIVEYGGTVHKASIALVRIIDTSGSTGGGGDDRPTNAIELIESGAMDTQDFNIENGYSVPKGFVPNFTPTGLSSYGLNNEGNSFWSLQFNEKSNVYYYDFNTDRVNKDTELFFKTKYRISQIETYNTFGFNDSYYMFAIFVGNMYLTRDLKWVAGNQLQFNEGFHTPSITLREFKMDIPPLPRDGNVTLRVYHPKIANDPFRRFFAKNLQLNIELISMYYE